MPVRRQKNTSFQIRTSPTCVPRALLSIRSFGVREDILDISQPAGCWPRRPEARFGSWSCENAAARRTDRIGRLSGCEFCRDDSHARSYLTDLRKIILRVFAISEFSHSLGP